MDSAHVALVQLQLQREGFATYRVDRPLTLGLSVANLAKVMRLVNTSDSITLRCDEASTGSEPTSISIICESNKQARTTEFTLNLISLDSESLGIPETHYPNEVTMNSSEFARLCRELYQLSETVTFEIASSFLKF